MQCCLLVSFSDIIVSCNKLFILQSEQSVEIIHGECLSLDILFGSVSLLLFIVFLIFTVHLWTFLLFFLITFLQNNFLSFIVCCLTRCQLLSLNLPHKFSLERSIRVASLLNRLSQIWYDRKVSDYDWVFAKRLRSRWHNTQLIFRARILMCHYFILF